AMTPMRPDRVTVKRNPDGTLSYNYHFQGISAQLNEDEVFHLKGFSLDGIMGISPIAQARQCLASAIAAEKVAGAFFRNGMRPSAILSAPTYLSEQQREQAREVIERFSGALNSGRVPLLEG